MMASILDFKDMLLVAGCQLLVASTFFYNRFVSGHGFSRAVKVFENIFLAAAGDLSIALRFAARLPSAERKKLPCSSFDTTKVVS